MVSSLRVREKAFTDLLDDTLSLLWVAKSVESQQNDLPDPGFLARNIILMAVLAVEACANCCLDALHVQGQFSDELERLSTLGKFDVFLLSRGSGKFLDRGRKDVQAVAALKRVRDDLVHPKPFVTEYRQVSSDEWQSIGRSYEALGLSRDSREWTAKRAEAAIRSALEFLRSFFVDDCNLTPQDVKGLLGNIFEIDGAQYPAAEWSRQTLEAVAALRLDVEFLGFDNLNTANQKTSS